MTHQLPFYVCHKAYKKLAQVKCEVIKQTSQGASDGRCQVVYVLKGCMLHSQNLSEIIFRTRSYPEVVWTIWIYVYISLFVAFEPPVFFNVFERSIRIARAKGCTSSYKFKRH